MESQKENMRDLEPAHILTLVRHSQQQLFDLEVVHIIDCDMVAKGTLVM